MPPDALEHALPRRLCPPNPSTQETRGRQICVSLRQPVLDSEVQPSQGHYHLILIALGSSHVSKEEQTD